MDLYFVLLLEELVDSNVSTEWHSWGFPADKVVTIFDAILLHQLVLDWFKAVGQNKHIMQEIVTASRLLGLAQIYSSGTDTR